MESEGGNREAHLSLSLWKLREQMFVPLLWPRHSRRAHTHTQGRVWKRVVGAEPESGDGVEGVPAILSSPKWKMKTKERTRKKVGESSNDRTICLYLVAPLCYFTTADDCLTL